MATDMARGNEPQVELASMPIARALWNMRWAAVFVGTPPLALVMIELTFGLPRHLVLLAAGFLLLSLLLFTMLVRGEIKRIRRAGRSR